MEKYGVDTKRRTKIAAGGCPECAAQLEEHGQVVICPACGSRPFEEVDDGEAQSEAEEE